jgi:hypothetical protein
VPENQFSHKVIFPSVFALRPPDLKHCVEKDSFTVQGMPLYGIGL